MSYSPVPAVFLARLWNKIYAHSYFDVTMQMMNEIESELGGRIVRILVKNGQPVEYGQPLMIIEPL